MRTIYKYKLPLEAFSAYHGRMPIKVPGCRNVLDVQLQDNIPTVWVECDSDGPESLVYFYIVGTGHEVPDGDHFYAGTIQLHGFVWHFYYNYDYGDKT